MPSNPTCYFQIRTKKVKFQINPTDLGSQLLPKLSFTEPVYLSYFAFLFALLYVYYISISFKNIQAFFVNLYNKNPRLSRHSQEILRTCTHTGGCLPKYSWVSYINVSIHAIFRGGLPIPKLVGSKISCLSYYAGKFINLFFLHFYLTIGSNLFSNILFRRFRLLKEFYITYLYFIYLFLFYSQSFECCTNLIYLIK